MSTIRIFQLIEGKLIEERVLNTLRSIIKSIKNDRILKLDFFLSFNDKDEYSNLIDEIKAIIQSVFKTDTPAITFIPQDTFHNEDMIIECHTINNPKKKINYKTLLNHHYVTISDDNSTEIISGGIQFNETSILMSAQRAFDFVEQILMAEDMNFSHIYRQWNYISNMMEKSSFDGNKKQNLEVFEEIKGFYYENLHFNNGFPASSNIGCRFGGVTIDFMAYNSTKYKILPIKGFKLPEFDSNAKFLESEKQEKIWISGIKDYLIKSVNNENDIEKQTLKSFHYLFSIIDNENIKKNGAKKLLKKSFKDNFTSFRVYIKDSTDYSKVNKIINDILPGIPCIYINAENDNQESLIEIEGTSIINSEK